MNIEKTKCERCGKEIYTSSHSFYGLDSLKKAFPVLCFGCSTPKERYSLNKKIGEAIFVKRRKQNNDMDN